MLMFEEDLSPQDVIAYRDDPVFSHKPALSPPWLWIPYPVRC
jgi:hypothetical protein